MRCVMSQIVDAGGEILSVRSEMSDAQEVKLIILGLDLGSILQQREANTMFATSRRLSWQDSCEMRAAIIWLQAYQLPRV